MHYRNLPVMMMNKNDYTEINDQQTHNQKHINNESNNRRNRNRFWDAGSFFREWSMMKLVMMSMMILLLGIIVFQGVEEQETVEKKIGTEEEALLLSSSSIDNNYNNGPVRDDDDDEGKVEKVIKDDDEAKAKKERKEASNNNNNKYDDVLPIPPGVNIGSWLSLEDYFFSGQHNSIEVATPGQLKTASKVASCLPPLHVGKTTGPSKWYSETDLFMNLMEKYDETTNGNINNVSDIGVSLSGIQYAIEVFQAHRTSYVDLEVDFERIASLGIKTIRLPISWCLTNDDPRRIDLTSFDDDELLDMFACVDPFFRDGGDLDDRTIYWPAVPKPFIEDVLRAAAKTNLGVSLDVHTYPGGTSIGTFSGVWPNWPRFWTHGGDGVDVPPAYLPNANATETVTTNNEDYNNTDKGYNIGFILFQNLVQWMEELSTRDPIAFKGLRGLSPMNEPAHLAGNFDVDDETNFLPPLPENIESSYRERFVSTNPNSLGNDFPAGTHLRVFRWFDGAIDIFRKSKLPKLGKQLHANIHESVLHSLSSDSDEIDAKMRMIAIATWWCSDTITDTDLNSVYPPTTTYEERTSWAILDMHHYHAWSDDCSGTVTGQNNAAYACGDIQQRTKVLKRCTEWAQIFRNTVDEICTPSQKKKKKLFRKSDNTSASNTAEQPMKNKLMSGEFSAATYHNSRRSCNDLGGLRDSYTRQVDAGNDADVELMYWSYKMPYGGTFRNAWSFSQLMYNLGVLDHPDTPQFDCDSNEVIDPELPSS